MMSNKPTITSRLQLHNQKKCIFIAHLLPIWVPVIDSSASSNFPCQFTPSAPFKSSAGWLQCVPVDPRRMQRISNRQKPFLVRVLPFPNHFSEWWERSPRFATGAFHRFSSSTFVRVHPTSFIISSKSDRKPVLSYLDMPTHTHPKPTTHTSETTCQPCLVAHGRGAHTCARECPVKRPR